MSIARRLTIQTGEDLRPFKFTIRISASNTEYQLPLTAPNGLEPALTVDWGDGTNISIYSTTSSNRFHTYAAAGDYQISISGLCPGFKVDNNSTYRGFYISVDDWGEVQMKEINFFGCSNLTTLPIDGSGNAILNEGLRGVRNFDLTFNRTGITVIPIGLFDYSTEVTSFINTFVFCQGLTSIPDNLFDNNTEVTSFAGTFNALLNLSTIPTGLFDNNTKVINFRSVFRNCRALTQIPEALFTNNQSVTNFSNAFNMATEANQLQNGSTPTDTNGLEIWERTPTPTGTDCFAFCTGLSNFNQIPTTFK